MSQPVKAIHNMSLQHDMHERRAHHICIPRLPNKRIFMIHYLQVFSMVMCLFWRLYSLRPKLWTKSCFMI